MKSAPAFARVSTAFALTLFAAPAAAWSDARVEEPTRDATLDAPPARDASVDDPSGPHVPDGRLQTFAVCAPTGNGIGTLDDPTRLRFEIDAPWAGSLSEIELSADVTGHEDIPVEQLLARVVGEPWVPFENLTWDYVAYEGECPEDSACDQYAVTLHGGLPALSRVPQPFELELGQTLGAHAAFDELCLRVTVYESATPGPLLRPSPDGPTDEPEADAFYDFWEDAPTGGDAGGADFPEGVDETPFDGGSTDERKGAGATDASGEKAGCSATAGALAGSSSGLPVILLLGAAVACRRRARRSRR